MLWRERGLLKTEASLVGRETGRARRLAKRLTDICCGGQAARSQVRNELDRTEEQGARQREGLDAGAAEELGGLAEPWVGEGRAACKESRVDI